MENKEPPSGRGKTTEQMVTENIQKAQQTARPKNSLSVAARFNQLFTKVEFMGVRGANFAHRGFVNCVLLFIGWNFYTFIRNYNNYWRLRRDPNVPKQWLEE